MKSKIKQYEKAVILLNLVGCFLLAAGVAAGFISFLVIFGIVFMVLAVGVKKRKEGVRVLARVLGCLLIPFFPIGTVAGIVLIRYLGEDWDKYIKPRIT